MRLPGTRYQEPGWEEVRKLLGQCSLVALRACAHAGHADDAGDGALGAYVERMGALLHAQRRSPRAQAGGNGYGETVFELALGLVYELGARPGDWQAFCAAVGAGSERLGAGVDDALLRKKVNDMYAQLRDKVDADNYQAACGRPCSPNRMYAYRMLDTAYGEIARLFGNWAQQRAQVGAILGRALDDAAVTPIEVRQLGSIADCRPEWLLRWSETLGRFGAGPGPLHTRSKRFASLKTSPDKIGAMLREIGEYETLSANRDVDFAQDLDDASVWMEDYWRVLQESEQAAAPGPDRILEAREEAPDADIADVADVAAVAAVADAGDAAEACGAPAAAAPAPDPTLEAAAVAVSLPPGYLHMAAEAAGEGAGAGVIAQAFGDDVLPVRLAVYARLLGPGDDSYPDAWRDPASGELPTMQQLAALAGVSLPTLRKRRDAAIARLQAQAPQPATTRRDR
ncbi:hypothetical protein [Massilia sp. 9096]|uniref:hypothetical protein n=1 Tax=Massilia sp. 9096 TaxID=1500894 RepID=UPI000568DE2C|nr:hypothetical protein [Massilia sp. 9096]